MIERLPSKKGHAIAKYDGRFICSSVDPVKEADDWYRKLESRLDDVNTIIVLGVGCGYHIAKLRAAVPNAIILAVDFNSEFLALAESLHSLAWAGVKNICLENFASISDCVEVCKSVRESYAVVHFAPATITQAQDYNAAELFLLGRTWAGFQFITGERNRLSGLFQNTVHALPMDSDSLLSIKTLCDRLSAQETRESMLLRALRELVV